MGSDFFERRHARRALVLGGGGAKGAYEIGVWKALDQLGYVPDILTGTSVGALNGALYILGDVHEAEKMWKQIETGSILDVRMPLSIDSFKDYRRTLAGFLIRIIREQGLSSRPLEKLIHEYIDNESKIRKSGITFGLSTTNLKTRKIEYFFLEDIPEGRLHDYLLASSSLYPAIQKKIIDGVPYIDGGYQNRMPIEMALEKKPDQIIVVDIKGPGLFSNDLNTGDCESLLISTKWPLGDMLLFDKRRTEVNVQLGYFDTLKLGEPDYYGGLWYTFNRKTLNDEQQQFYLALYELLTGERSRDLYSYISKEEHQLPMLKDLNRRWKEAITESNVALAVMELTGKILNILPDRLYTVCSFQKEILRRIRKMQAESELTPIEELQPRFILSGKEWSEEFLESLPLLSNRALMLQLLEWLEDDTFNWEVSWHKLLIRTRPFPLVMALYLKYLLNKE